MHFTCPPECTVYTAISSSLPTNFLYHSSRQGGPAASPHQLHVVVQASPASRVWARQRFTRRHLWPPARLDGGCHLAGRACTAQIQE